MLAKIKDFVKEHREEIVLFIGVILISLLSFAMGYIAAKSGEKEPLRFEEGVRELMFNSGVKHPYKEVKGIEQESNYRPRLLSVSNF